MYLMNFLCAFLFLKKTTGAPEARKRASEVMKVFFSVIQRIGIREVYLWKVTSLLSPYTMTQKRIRITI
jgi:hypothetical protein